MPKSFKDTLEPHSIECFGQSYLFLKDESGLHTAEEVGLDKEERKGL